jgi:hypothetical protein
MRLRRAQPIVCAEPLPPLTADDVLALALSVIRGRVFGSRSAEVKLLRLALRRCGFDICRIALSR